MLQAAKDFKADSLPYPNLDFGCMDGLNSYLLLGGEPPFAFDVFESIFVDSNMHLRTSLDDDYYETMSAALSVNMEPVSRPFTVGVDWKESHIQKAAGFGAHIDLRCESRESLLSSFADDSFRGIWAPNVYWMDNVGQVLKEFWRIAESGARIVTILPDLALLDSMVFRHAHSIDRMWLSYLDRGRYENATRSARTLSEWMNLFEDSQIEVLRHEMFLPAAINQIYEIGFRPMFGPLLELRSSLKSVNTEALLKVKHLWIDRLQELTYPLLDEQLMLQFDDGKLWHIFEVTPIKN
jgi:hypothetical protein